MLNPKIIQEFNTRQSVNPSWTLVPIFLLFLTLSGVISAYSPNLTLLAAIGTPLSLALLVWPEAALSLYANAGLFKADPRFAPLNQRADITVALAAILLAASIYRLVVRRNRLVWTGEISLALIFAAVLLMGLVYTPAGDYGVDKAFRFLTLTLLAFLTPLIIIKTPRSLWLFFLAWIGFASILTIESLSGLRSGERFSGFNATPIALSRTVGIGVLILIFGLMLARRRPLLSAVGLFFMMWVLIGSGSRGPLLSLVLTVGVALLVNISRESSYRFRSILIIGILVLTMFAVFSSGLVPKSSMDRFANLTNGVEGDTSTQARLLVSEVAWDLFTSSPIIGHGTGSVSAFGAGRELIYPHNVLLELAAETGLIGLSIYLILMGMVFWRLLTSMSKDTEHGYIYLTLIALLLFTLLNSMVSGDLSDNRNVWLIAGVSLAATNMDTETTP